VLCPLGADAVPPGHLHSPDGDSPCESSWRLDGSIPAADTAPSGHSIGPRLVLVLSFGDFVMNGIQEIEGQLTIRGARIALLVSRFNSFIVESLLSGAVDTLKRHGAEARELQIVRVPGAYEMPIAAKRLAASQRYDAIVALGAVIRGGTPHFEYVAGECTKGLSQVSLQHDIPIAFGVLTVDSIEQAIERAGTKAGNKGAEAALSAIEMINVLREIGG